jgi:hypothetical protein
LSSATGRRFGGVVVAALALLPADAYLPPPAAPLPLATPHATSAAEHHTYHNTLASRADERVVVPGVRRGRPSSLIDAGHYSALLRGGANLWLNKNIEEEELLRALCLRVRNNFLIISFVK